MSGRDSVTVAAETKTEYNVGSFTCDCPVMLHISHIGAEMATQLCRHLSVFIETHERDAYEQAVSLLRMALDGPDRQYVASVGEPRERPDECHPIRLWIEGIDRHDAAQIVGGFNTLIIYQAMTGDLPDALVSATEDQPRSIVQQINNDEGQPDAHEWHTDTDATLASPDA